VPRPISPLSAAFRLLALIRGSEPMTDVEFDACVDSLVDLLERANDEKYQLTAEDAQGDLEKES